MLQYTVSSDFDRATAAAGAGIFGSPEFVLGARNLYSIRCETSRNTPCHCCIRGLIATCRRRLEDCVTKFPDNNNGAVVENERTRHD